MRVFTHAKLREWLGTLHIKSLMIPEWKGQHRQAYDAVLGRQGYVRLPVVPPLAVLSVACWGCHLQYSVSLVADATCSTQCRSSDIGCTGGPLYGAALCHS